ncbi:MAG: nucleotide sugar dehydrogenase [Holosporales bacterium]|jgi:UDPglucose 6-dehydrogenase|nr:nucleotide sugar dehydrogenase [Holosporales bacterium]
MMVITVIGCGFVGSVSAVCLCGFGFQVWLYDEDQTRLERLKNNASPADEPGVAQAVVKHLASGQLTFSDNVYNMVYKSDVVVIAVPTLNKNSDFDMSNLHDTIRKVVLSLSNTHYTAIVIKTNIPVGAGSIIADNTLFLRTDIKLGKHYDIITNPGILREGSAIQDFMEPNVVLVGTGNESTAAKSTMLKMYATIAASKVPFVFASYETVEIIRAGAIGFLAIKMAYINEIADICSRCGADINTVTKGIASDHRIGPNSLRVSPGFGGTSFPRTVRVLSNAAKSLGVNLSIIDAAIESNTSRIASIKPQIMKLLNDANGKALPIAIKRKVAILGLSFKPLTSDIRESPSLFVIKDLLAEEHIDVWAYDPLFKSSRNKNQCIPTAIREHKNFRIVESVYDAISQSDIVVIMTNWNEFISLDLKKVRELMNKPPYSKPIILDYRNMFSPERMKAFHYVSQGQPVNT